MTDNSTRVRQALAAYKFQNGIRYDSQVARELGLTRGAFENWLAGRVTSRPTARKLAALGLPTCGECGQVSCGGCQKKDEKKI